jgi:hypothetical protein
MIGYSTLATAIVLAFTGIFVWRQLRDAKKTRHGALLADLSRRWDEPLIVESQRLFASYSTAGIVELVEKLYGSGASDKEREDFVTLEAVPNFWETIGVLERDGSITTTVVDKMWGDAIRSAWRDWEEPVTRLRELTEVQRSYKNFEDVADAVRRFRLEND